MKKHILTLMVSAAVFAGSPVFGMDEGEKDNRHILSSKLETPEQ